MGSDRPGTPYSNGELDIVARITITRAQANLDDMLNEFESRYRDADSHALLAELRPRIRETLVMLTPQLPHSGR